METMSLIREKLYLNVIYGDKNSKKQNGMSILSNDRQRGIISGIPRYGYCSGV